MMKGNEYQIYAIPVKARPINLYANESDPSKSSLRSHREEPDTSSNSLTPLMMSQDIKMSTMNGGIAINNDNRSSGSYENSNCNSSDFSDINSSENGSASGGSSTGIGGNNSKFSNGIPPIPHKKQQRVFKKQKTVDSNPMPVPGTKETQFHTGSLKETPNFKSSPERARGASFPGAETDTVTDYDAGGYLTPADPPPYMESGFRFEPSQTPASPTHSETNSLTSSLSYKNKRQPFQRFDSGVDCESDRGSSVRFSTSPSMTSGASISNPRLSTHYEQHYEDIDKYQKSNGNIHQPKRSSIEKMGMTHSNSAPPNALRPLPQINIGGVTHSDSEDVDPHLINTSMAETVSGSAHDARDSGTLPHMYAPLNMGAKFDYSAKSKASSSRCSCCVIVFIIICFLVSLAALALSLYLFVSKDDSSPTTIVMPDGSAAPSNLSMLIFDMKKELSDLQKEVISLREENRILKENVTFVRDLASQIQPSSNQSSLRQEIQMVQNDLRAELANISLMPGPQGPPGITNFSLCTNQSISMTAVPSNQKTSTSFLPSEEEIKDHFVIFAYCSYEAATDAVLITSSTRAGTRFGCSCWGVVGNSGHTRCTIDIWMCPRFS